MKIYHLRHHRWVKHRKITSKLTFASPVGDAVRHCKEDFAKLYSCDIDCINVQLMPPYITLYLIGMFRAPKKTYKMVNLCQDTSTLTLNKPTSTEPLNKELWPSD